MGAELIPYKMGDFLRVKHGFPFLGEFFSTRGKYIVLTPGNFYESGGFKRTLGKEKYYISEFPEEYLCSEGDLIVAMTEQAEGLLGSTAIIPENDVYLHNQRIGLISWDVNIVDKQYLYYLFMTRSVRKQIRDTASGTKVKHTSPERIYDVSVSIPDITVQQKNAALLWMLDQKIQLNNRIIAELEAMAKSIFDYWFVQFDFPNDNGRPYRSSGGTMEWNEELKREIPKGWRIGKLSDVANITMGQSPDGGSYNEDEDGMVFFQGCTDFGCRFPKTRIYTNQPSRIAEQGDVLLSVRAPVGTINIATEQCCIGRGLAALHSKCGANSYLLCLMQSLKPVFDVINGNGTTFGALTKDMLFDINVCVPSSPVLTAFEEITNKMNDCIFNREMQTRELTKLCDWLLPMLMNGQATVE